MPKKLNVLIVTAEATPFAKVGGLADVAGSLPKALLKLGHDVRVIMPCYQRVEEKFPLESVVTGIPVYLRDVRYDAGIKKIVKDDVTFYFLDIPFFFRRSEVYMYNDDGERFISFCKGVLEGLPRLGWKPDVIHCNDWQTALVPSLLKTSRSGDPFYDGTGTVFTIHNLAYQGTFPDYYTEIAGLPWDVFHFTKMEYYGKLNLMKGGIVYSDQVNTVSEQYKEEIKTPEYGEGLDGLLIAQDDKLSGILNGIDLDEFNPATDKRIFQTFSPETIERKEKDKEGLLAEVGLPRVKSKRVPLVGLISRFANQKGFDIIAEVLDKMMALDVQMVVLGTGDPAYHEMFTEAMKKYPKKLSAQLKFDAVLAQKIYAGSDMFLMPSKFEPCGLGQIISLRYGTVPVVRATGGLADTISNYNARTGKGNGFVFKDYTGAALLRAFKRAVEVYGKKDEWHKLALNAMACDFSWEASAKKYVDLYGKTLK